MGGIATMKLKTHLLHLYRYLMETDRDERPEALRGIADYYETKAREARREINLVMSEQVINRMRGMGL